MEEDEKCSRFFFKKAFSPKKVMRMMLDGQEDVGGKRMREVVRSFYTDLYGGEDSATMEEVEEYCSVLSGAVKKEKGAFLAKVGRQRWRRP